MTSGQPTSLPDPHRAFVARAVERLSADARLVGLAAAGSYADDSMDEYSDLDLVVAVNPDDLAAVLADRQRIAGTLGPLLAAFTGEHVGEPRLLICLYGPPLLHVDLKFVALPDAGKRVDDQVVLWERDGRLTAALGGAPAAYPEPDPQWLEDRFWVWVHYVAGKIGRGELFEAIDCLAFLRARVLGPMALQRAGLRPAGVRKLEALAPSMAEELKATVATYDARTLLSAARACVSSYRRLRGPTGTTGIRLHAEAERAAMDYLALIESRLASR